MALRAPSQVTTAEAAQEAEEAVATTRGGRCARSLWWRSMSGWIAAAANVASKGGAEGEGGLPAELVQGLNSLMHIEPGGPQSASRQPIVAQMSATTSATVKRPSDATVSTW